MAIVKGPDFTKKNKDVLCMRLPDGEGGGFDLSVFPPTKNGWDAISAIAVAIDGVMTGETDAQDFDMDAALDAVAEVMSNNTAFKKVDREMLNLIGFDLQDIGTFTGAYIEFVAGLVMEKN